MRLGTSEQGLTEIMPVAEHINSLAVLAEGFSLRADVPPQHGQVIDAQRLDGSGYHRGSARAEIPARRACSRLPTPTRP